MLSNLPMSAAYFYCSESHYKRRISPTERKCGDSEYSGKVCFTVDTWSNPRLTLEPLIPLWKSWSSYRLSEIPRYPFDRKDTRVLCFHIYHQSLFSECYHRDFHQTQAPQAPQESWCRLRRPWWRGWMILPTHSHMITHYSTTSLGPGNNKGYSE